MLYQNIFLIGHICKYVLFFLLFVFDPFCCLVYYLELDACNGPTTMSLQEGISIESPGYPMLYQHDLSCNWLVNIPDIELVILTFDDVQLSNSNSSCLEDYIIIETSDMSGGLNRTR